ncbi:hypothetical protein [uncultured Parasphingorhabdus sp.]|tara:strand:+ start:49391 stop:49519 length:129 start_codon:yes stop_codon:yes gene_type:complete
MLMPLELDCVQNLILSHPAILGKGNGLIVQYYVVKLAILHLQ